MITRLVVKLAVTWTEAMQALDLGTIAELAHLNSRLSTRPEGDRVLDVCPISKPEEPTIHRFVAGAATQIVDWAQIPVVFGVLAFVYAGHGVFPAIAKSMKRPKEFPKVCCGCDSLHTPFMSLHLCPHQILSENTLDTPKVSD